MFLLEHIGQLLIFLLYSLLLFLFCFLTKLKMVALQKTSLTDNKIAVNIATSPTLTKGRMSKNIRRINRMHFFLILHPRCLHIGLVECNPIDRYSILRSTFARQHLNSDLKFHSHRRRI